MLPIVAMRSFCTLKEIGREEKMKRCLSDSSLITGLRYSSLLRFTVGRSLVTFLVVFFLFIVLPLNSFAADKLIVKDSTGTNTVFRVDDTGEMFTGGTDANNAFQLHVLGHVGGASHVQLTTNLTNSKFSLIASSSNDFAPRFQAVGPQDASYPGWVVFDFGSNLFSLPSAEFKIRHYDTTGPMDMITVTGRTAVSFPNGNVGIGTTTPTQKLDVNDNSIRVEQPMIPASSSAACNQGQVAWDANYVYVCVAANTWKRAALASW